MAILLVVDVGNSTIHLGLFSGEKVSYRYGMPVFPRQTEKRYSKEIKSFLLRNGIELPLKGVIIASVVTELTGVLVGAIRGLSSEAPLVVDATLDTGFRFEVPHPEEIGADRIADMVAAVKMCGPTAVVVDFGTATTISIVKDLRFKGGAILPGVRLMSESLHRGTSKLPFLDSATVKGERGSRISAIGRNTIGCMISGIIYGTAGAVQRIIAETEHEEGCPFDVVITGGYASVIAPVLTRRFTLDRDLVFKGLKIIYERNIRCTS
jgi:type III pantothenate kinase